MAEVDAPHVYITYHQDPESGEVARRLATDLAAAGAVVALLDDSPSAPAVTRAMLTDPSEDRWLVALVAPPSVTSPWILNAVNSAQEAVVARRMRGVLVVVIAPVPEQNIPVAWRSFPRFDATTSGYDGARDALLAALGLPGEFSATGSTGPATGAGAGDDRDETDAPSGSVLADERARSVTSEAPEAEDGAAPPQSDAAPPAPQPAPAAEEASQPRYPGAPRSAGEADDDLPEPVLPFESPPTYPDSKGYGPPQPVPGREPAPPAPPTPYSQPPSPPAYPAPAPSQQGAGGPASPALPEPVALERVAFAAYYPKEARPAKPLPLLVYLALDDAPAMARVAALAAERLAGRLDQFRSGVADDRMTLRRGTKLRLVPVIPGFHVNPQWMDVTWDEDAQQHEFTVRADSAPPDRAAEGAVRVYQGLNLRAQIPVSIFVSAGTGAAPTPADFASAYARAYRQVFASYSHRDMPVVESCEAAARAFGDRYLRDLITLQSGQQWNNQLMRMIAEADVFQLFWSRNAAASPVVHLEWEYALTLQASRPGFIHPVYWSRAPFDIPRELGPLHFAPLDLSALGWSPVRRFLYSLQTG